MEKAVGLSNQNVKMGPFTDTAYNKIWRGENQNDFQALKYNLEKY